MGLKSSRRQSMTRGVVGKDATQAMTCCYKLPSPIDSGTRKRELQAQIGRFGGSKRASVAYAPSVTLAACSACKKGVEAASCLRETHQER